MVKSIYQFVKGGGSMDQSPDLSNYPLSILIKIADRVIDDVVVAKLGASGFDDVRHSHRAVFEMIDRTGTRITDLARRARITKQGMGQLVDDLEALGYVESLPDPTDGRAKLVSLTAKGRDAVGVARAATTELEGHWACHLGEERARELRAAMAEICATFAREHIR